MMENEKIVRRKSVELPTISLALLTKKKEILQSVMTQLEFSLRDRTTYESQLHEVHEKRLTINGILQQKHRARTEKMEEIDAKLEHAATVSSTREIPPPLDHFRVTADKITSIEALLIFLHRCVAQLEQVCMEREEKLLVKTLLVRRLKDLQSQAGELQLMTNEDYLITLWTLENERKETVEASQRMSVMAQECERMTLEVEEMNQLGQTINTEHQTLCVRTNNIVQMAYEDTLQLLIIKHPLEQELATIEQSQVVHRQDEQLDTALCNLTVNLQSLSDRMKDAKYYNREVHLRRKQQVVISSLASVALKSRNDQLQWILRQEIYHMKELKEMERAHADDEQEFKIFREYYEAEMTSVMGQLKELELEYSDVSKRLHSVVSVHLDRKKSLRDEAVDLERCQLEWQSHRQRYHLLQKSVHNLEVEYDIKMERFKTKSTMLYQNRQELERIQMAYEDLIPTHSRITHYATQKEIALAAQIKELAMTSTDLTEQMTLIETFVGSEFTTNDIVKMESQLSLMVQIITADKDHTINLKILEERKSERTHLIATHYTDIMESCKLKHDKLILKKIKEYEKLLNAFQERQKIVLIEQIDQIVEPNQEVIEKVQASNLKQNETHQLTRYPVNCVTHEDSTKESTEFYSKDQDCAAKLRKTRPPVIKISPVLEESEMTPVVIGSCRKASVSSPRSKKLEEASNPCIGRNKNSRIVKSASVTPPKAPVKKRNVPADRYTDVESTKPVGRFDGRGSIPPQPVSPFHVQNVDSISNGMSYQKPSHRKHAMLKSRKQSQSTGWLNDGDTFSFS